MNYNMVQNPSLWIKNLESQSYGPYIGTKVKNSELGIKVFGLDQDENSELKNIILGFKFLG